MSRYNGRDMRLRQRDIDELRHDLPLLMRKALAVVKSRDRSSAIRALEDHSQAERACMRTAYANGVSVADIAREFNVGYNWVWRVVRRRIGD